MELIIIAAVAENNAIGANQDLLFHISDDLKHFKALTMGSPIIMGRKTFESFPRGPLPGRRNIVITRNPVYHREGIEVVTSLQEALSLVSGSEKAFIIGGGQIYEQALPHADKLEITRILTPLTVKPDTFFPDFSNWELLSQDETRRDAKSGVDYCFETYRK